MHRNSDVSVPIYSIMCPAGVSLWLSVNPRDLPPDLEVLSPLPSLAECLKESTAWPFLKMTVRTSVRGVWQVGNRL